MSIIDSIQYLKALKSLERGKGLYKSAGYPYLYKSAAQPPAGPPPGGDPGAGGPPPGDPSMGGMPPGGDPSMGGMPPGGDPSMGGMPPGGDPSMMGGGMPPMDPMMMGGGMPPMDPMMMGGGMPPGQSPQETEQKVTNKIKTEQWMQHIDSYNYNLLKLMINLYEHMGIPVPAESLLPQPLGQSAPSAGDISGMMGAAATATAPQSPIDAMTNGDAAPPNAGGGAPPMDPGMMGPPPGGDMGAGGPPPMEGGDVKQSSWNGYNPYYNTSWHAPYHRQAGVSPAPQRAKQASYFNYPRQYRDFMTKFDQLQGFDRGW